MLTRALKNSRSRPRLVSSDREREVVTAISRLAFCNPFTPERLRLERQVLGEAFTPFDVVWHAQTDAAGANPNVPGIAAKALELAEEMRARLAGPQPAASREELELYRALVLYLLYNRYQLRLFEGIHGRDGEGRPGAFGFYREFLADLERYLDPPALGEGRLDPAHLFACCFQIRRAFHFTFRSIVGGSMPAAQLRERVWQSIFTHDLQRYQRALYCTMGDITTLVTGPSGTGKELVARAIGHSRYIPFDAKALRFRESWAESFYPLNLSALSPTLIESELFGHRRGAFTGAVADRTGWFEVCPPLGTVFLDEIGETEPAIQVKLLRVLETRTFQRLGETRSRRFQGKVVAATNRDLAREMQEERFRADLYYRLCSDLLVTPSLRERIAAAPEELSNLILFLAERAVGEELAAEVAREAEEVLRRYCTLVYARTGSYEEAARHLDLDRRTVKSRVDPDLLTELRG